MKPRSRRLIFLLSFALLMGSPNLRAVIYNPGPPPLSLGQLFYYDLGTSITIVGCTNPSDFINIPATISGKPVTEIATLPPYLSNFDGLTGVSVPSSVTSIALGTFDRPNLTEIDVDPANPNYTSINGVLFNKTKTQLLQYPPARADVNYTIPSGVTSIADSALAAPSLLGLTIPNSVTSIGSYAFSGSGLAAITIPEGVNSLPYEVFAYCKNLTSVSLPDTLTSIGSSEFSGCSSLTTLTIPKSVTSIGSNGFYQCTKLANINVASLNETFASVDGVLFNKALTQLIQFPVGRTKPYSIPNGVVSIGDYAFNSSLLTDITIPNGVTSIGQEAFEYCTNLTSVTFPQSITTVDNYAFGSCNSLTRATFQGNAPANFSGAVFFLPAQDFEIYYSGSATGFTPLWQGLPAYNLDAPPAILANVSTRSFVGTGSGIEIAGFVITGTKPKQVLIRAGGPALAASFALTGVLSDPTLSLYNQSGALITSNTGWGTATNSDQIKAAAKRVGAYSWADGSLDSALLLILQPGIYTAGVSGASNDTGLGMVEVYDADTTASSRMINISTRSLVKTDDQIQIAGFVIVGDQPKKVLIRASGPALKSTFGMTGVLSDPVLTLFDQNNTLLAQNIMWQYDISAGAPVAPVYVDALKAAAARVGAFPWSDGSADSAFLITLQPGAYTAQVSGQSGDSGTALLEVYDAD